MIKIFFHVAPMNHWRETVNKIRCSLESSGLLFEASVYVCFAGRGWPIGIHKSWVKYWSKLDQYEFPALVMLKKYTTENDKILYLHTKGVSHPNDPIKTRANKWLDFMLWGCVEHWREMIAALDSHDVAGVNWISKPKQWATKCGAPGFYGGNFWWARGDYIQKLKPTPDNKWGNRWLAEGWIGTAKPRIYDFKNLTDGGVITTTFPDFNREEYDKPPERNKKRPRVRGRNEIINHLIKKHGYKSYLEIGVLSGWNFNRIECPHKISVDPAPKCEVVYKLTSDEYFARTFEKFDIIFIDGLHTAEQVGRDIENSLTRLNPGGTIVCHDMLPETPFECRNIPEYDGVSIWTGTCWEAFAKLRMTRPDLWQAVVDVDFGVGLIRPGKQKLYPEMELTFKNYYRNRQELMNIIEPDDFLESEI